MDRCAPAGQCRRLFLGLALGLAVGWTEQPGWGAARPWESFVYGGESTCATSRGDTVWVGTGAGVRVFEPRGAQLRLTREIGLNEQCPVSPVRALSFVGRNLWLGGNGVVARLDLETNAWQVLDQTTSLPAADISRICFDGTNLWVATLGGGVAQFGELKQQWQVFGADDGLPSERVYALVADEGGLWAGTEQGLARRARGLGDWSKVDGTSALLNGAIRDLCATDRYLWLAGGSNGLGRLSLKTGELVGYDLRQQFASERVDRVLLTADDTLWVATDNGILRAEKQGDAGGRWTFMRRPVGKRERPTWQVEGLTTAGGNLWAATRDEGLFCYRGDAGEWQQFATPELFPSGSLTAAAGQSNAFWVGFRGDGLARYDIAAEAWRRVPAKDALPCDVRELAVRERMVYCATRDGLQVFDDRESKWQKVTTDADPALGGNDWSSVLCQGTDRLWLAGPGRLAQLNQLTLAVNWVMPLPDIAETMPDRQPQLYEDPVTLDVWVATRSALRRYVRRTNELRSYDGAHLRPTDRRRGLNGRYVRDLVCDNDSVWVVTTDKLLQIRKQEDVIVPWEPSAYPELRGPECVVAGDLEVYVAAAGGLARFNRQEQSWSQVKWPLSFGEEPVTALALDPSDPTRLWAATARGAAILDLAAKRPDWRPVGRGTGLVSGIRRIVVGERGVWFVGRGGVSVYHRDLERE